LQPLADAGDTTDTGAADASESQPLPCVVEGVTAGCPSDQPAPASACDGRVGQICAYPSTDPSSVAIMTCDEGPDFPPGWSYTEEACADSLASCFDGDTRFDVPGPPCAQRPMQACQHVGGRTERAWLHSAFEDIFTASGVAINNESSIYAAFDDGCAVRVNVDPTVVIGDIQNVLDRLGQVRLDCAVHAHCTSVSFSTLAAP
jgi:hypothetical protein